MEKYKVITITYKNVSLSDLGKYVIPKGTEEQLYESKLKELKEHFHLNELLYLQTCNRVLFFFVTDAELNEAYLQNFFKSINPALSEDELQNLHSFILTFEGRDAVNHLMDVAASIDSMVLGEREIPKQLRLAYEECHKMGLTGDRIRVAVKTAIQTSKRIFTHTKISHKPISVVSLAADQLMKHNLPKETRFLIIGAGHTNNIMTKFLLNNQFHDFVVFNRTKKNADILAEKLKCEAHGLDALKDYKKPFDVIISCTGSTEPIISKSLYQQMLNGDECKKIIVDLAIPYDIDQQIATSFNVDYIEIEQLREIARQNLNFRKSEMEKAKLIIHQDLNEFIDLFKKRQIEIAMRDVSFKIKEIKNHALNTVFSKEIEKLDPDSKEILEKVLQYMEKKYISIPMTVAKDAFSGK